VYSEHFYSLAGNEYLMTSARNAFKHILKHLNIQNTQKILLPSYIGITDTEGSGVFDPVCETNTPYSFYPLNKRLEIERSSFEDLLKTGQFRAVLIIHYFGFPQNDMEWICSICKEYRVILIEDCAHTMHSSVKGITVGSFGDLSFFSIHKIIATDDGGVLKINNLDLGVPEVSVNGQVLSQATIDQFHHTDFEQIQVLRRKNYHYLLEQLSVIPQITVLHPHLEKETVPLNFPILIHEGKREAFYFKLEERGVITCSLYYRLIDQIEQEQFPIAHQLSEAILNLPVHQDTSEEELDFLTKQLKAAVAEVF